MLLAMQTWLVRFLIGFKWDVKVAAEKFTAMVSLHPRAVSFAPSQHAGDVFCAERSAGGVPRAHGPRSRPTSHGRGPPSGAVRPLPDSSSSSHSEARLFDSTACCRPRMVEMLPERSLCEKCVRSWPGYNEHHRNYHCTVCLATSRARDGRCVLKWCRLKLCRFASHSVRRVSNLGEHS